MSAVRFDWTHLDLTGRFDWLLTDHHLGSCLGEHPGLQVEYTLSHLQSAIDRTNDGGESMS